MSILVFNTGSSSLKFTLFGEEETIEVSGEVDWHDKEHLAELVVRLPDQPERRKSCEAFEPGAAAELAIKTISETLLPNREIMAIGHRIVHGGTRFLESVRIDPALRTEIDNLADLAPLHNPPALKAIEAAGAALPGVPQVAVFDTSFFAHMPQSAAIYPLPWEWHEKYGIRRFGFHGISHSYCSTRAAEILGRDLSTLRTVVCHIGNGCSASAIQGGLAVGTTMGFTPLAGLMMGTRSGEVDPGILLYLIREKGMSAEDLDDALNHQSGLLGVSGLSSDYRKVEEAARLDNHRAKLAVEIYAARVKSAIGGLAATLGGLDVLVFTAGVGENSATFRAAVCQNLDFLGVRLDFEKNGSNPRDSDIALADSTARVLVIHTREDLMIAREVRKFVTDT